MPHPVMFREDDFGLADVRRIALAFPEAFEKISHGRPVFCAPKIFVMFGGSSKETGERVTFPYSILFKPSETEKPALEQDGRFFYPMYLGPSGWLGLDLSVGTVDWDEVEELVDTSYRLIATKKLITQLDDQNPGAT